MHVHVCECVRVCVHVSVVCAYTCVPPLHEGLHPSLVPHPTSPSDTHKGLYRGSIGVATRHH